MCPYRDTIKADPNAINVVFLTSREMLNNLIETIPDSNVTCFRIRYC